MRPLPAWKKWVLTRSHDKSEEAPVILRFRAFGLRTVVILSQTPGWTWCTLIYYQYLGFSQWVVEMAVSESGYIPSKCFFCWPNDDPSVDLGPFSDRPVVRYCEGHRWDGVEWSIKPHLKNMPLRLFLQSAPPVISWFINPINYKVISIINHSYWTYKPT